MAKCLDSSKLSNSSLASARVVVVDPSEEKIKSEFENVKRTYLPMHSIIRIDEVDKQGASKISKLEGNVTPVSRCRSIRRGTRSSIIPFFISVAQLLRKVEPACRHLQALILSTLPLTRIEMLELPGQSALSDFRLAKLLHLLQRQDDERVKSDRLLVSCLFRRLYQHPFPPTTRQRLNGIAAVRRESRALAKGAHKVYVVPRPGTISPWSSKATDIALACDLDVERIERGICYGLQLRGLRSARQIFRTLGKACSIA